MSSARIDARDPLTGKLVWTRPTVEGHMGYTFDGWDRSNGIRHHQRHLDRRPVEDRRRCHLERRATYDPETNLIFAGTGSQRSNGTATCARATACSRSTVAIDADTGRSPGTIQNTRTMAGTLTAWI